MKIDEIIGTARSKGLYVYICIILFINNNAIATGNVDYTSGPYNVTFPTGITNVSFDVVIKDDKILEGNEYFTLSINSSNLPNNITVTDRQAIVTIVDDDRKL